MSHSFQKIPAKPTFQNIREPTYASDYIQSKKEYLTYCQNKNKLSCNVTQCKKTGWTDGDYLLYKNGKKLAYDSVSCSQYNPYELYSGLLRIQDLNGVAVLLDNSSKSSPAPVKFLLPENEGFTPYYWTLTIDPSGSLFGNTDCGLYNFLNYSKPL